MRHGVRALAGCLAASPAWRRSKGRDHVAVVSSTRDPKKLFGDGWTYLKRGVTLRIEASDDRYARAAAKGHEESIAALDHVNERLDNLADMMTRDGYYLGAARHSLRCSLRARWLWDSVLRPNV